MAETFDPYYKWLGIPPKDQPPHHYRLLGIELFEEDRDVIDAAANRVMAYLKDLATGDEAAYSQKLLNEIAQARICLLNKGKKAAYDQQLRARFEATPVAPEPAEWPMAVPPPVASADVSEAAAPPGAIDLERLVAGVRENAPAHAGRRAHPLRHPAKASGAPQRPLVLWALIGGGVCLALGIVLLAWMLTGRTRPPRETASNGGSGGTAAPKAVLVIGLSEAERRELKEFRIDGTVQRLPPRPEYRLAAGEHLVLLQRPGYADVQEKKLVDATTRWELRPRWQPLKTGPADASKLLARREPAFHTPPEDGFSRGFGSQVGHWTFDDTLDDRSGNFAGFQTAGTPEFADGHAGRALVLKADQPVTTKKPLIAESSEFTIAGWFKLSAVPTTDAAVLDGGGVAMHLPDGCPQVRVGAKRPRTGKQTETKTGGLSGINWSQSLGAWSHLAVVYAAPSRQVHYYWNGEHKGFQTFAGRAPARIGLLTIANLQGAVDDLRVFDYRLGSADVRALYDGSFRPLPAPPATADGNVICQTWFDVVPGLSRGQVELLTQRAPDETAPLGKELALSAARGDTDYLTRVRGFLFPRQSGDYVFTLQTTGEAALFLQHRNPAAETVVQVVASRRRPQDSAPLELESGKAYYFEILCQYASRRAAGFRLTWRTPITPARQTVSIPTAQLAGYNEPP